MVFHLNDLIAQGSKSTTALPWPVVGEDQDLTYITKKFENRDFYRDGTDVETPQSGLHVCIGERATDGALPSRVFFYRFGKVQNPQ